MGGITLRSSAFQDHDRMPGTYSHAAGDVSPPLEWSGVPEGTAELVVTCEDPDAPRGTFVHWLLAGIPPDTTALRAGERPSGAVPGRNGFGGLGYGGPHPPPGDRPHRYVFRLYATGQPLGLSPGFTRADLRAALDGRVLADGALVGTYRR